MLIAKILVRHGALCTLWHFSIGTSSGLDLCRLFPCCHSLREFMCVPVLVCLEEFFFLESSTINPWALSGRGQGTLFCRDEASPWVLAQFPSVWWYKLNLAIACDVWWGRRGMGTFWTKIQTDLTHSWQWGFTWWICLLFYLVIWFRFISIYVYILRSYLAVGSHTVFQRAFYINCFSPYLHFTLLSHPPLHFIK